MTFLSALLILLQKELFVTMYHCQILFLPRKNLATVERLFAVENIPTVES